MSIVFMNKGQNIVSRRCGSKQCFSAIGNSQHLEITKSTFDYPTKGFLKLEIVRVCLECKTETNEEINKKEH